MFLVSKFEIGCLVTLFCELTKHKMDRLMFRDVLHNQFDMTDDLIMDRGQSIRGSRTIQPIGPRQFYNRSIIVKVIMITIIMIITIIIIVCFTYYMSAESGLRYILNSDLRPIRKLNFNSFPDRKDIESSRAVSGKRQYDDINRRIGIIIVQRAVID